MRGVEAGERVRVGEQHHATERIGTRIRVVEGVNAEVGTVA